MPALDAFFAGYRATAVTTEVIKAFIRKRQEAGIGNGGINCSLAMLRCMFWLQAKERKFPRNLIPYFPMLSKPQGRRDFLTPEQDAALVKDLPAHLAPLQAIAYDTGARKGELLKLTWADVDLNSGALVLHDTKNGEDRAVPLGKDAVKTLKALVQTFRAYRVLVEQAKRAAIAKRDAAK